MPDNVRVQGQCLGTLQELLYDGMDKEYSRAPSRTDISIQILLGHSWK